MSRCLVLSLALFSLVVMACKSEPAIDAVVPDRDLSSLLDDAEERQAFHQIDLSLSTPLETGLVRLYRLMSGEVQFLEVRRFDQTDPEIHLGYTAPVSASSSVVLIHIVTAGLSAGRPDEYVCFSEIDHSTTRHTSSVRCDLSSTVAYYLSASRVGRSGKHPFVHVSDRFPLWRAIVDSDDNDVSGFYFSVFGTLQNALVEMGSDRFDLARFSVRPVMETIVARSLDLYQRQGSLSASQIVEIANRVTDHTLPLERLTRYETVFTQFAYVADVELDHTGGSLTRRSRQIELLTMRSELVRFFVRDAPYEMSDFRTHIVQNVHHEPQDNGTFVSWDPIPHMYGYNVYYNGEHVSYSRVPGILVPSSSRGTVTVKAVGYAGEFDGVHHELVGPTLIAGSDHASD